MIGVRGHRPDRRSHRSKNSGVSVTLILLRRVPEQQSFVSAVPQDVSNRARKVIRREFAEELENGADTERGTSQNIKHRLPLLVMAWRARPGILQSFSAALWPRGRQHSCDRAGVVRNAKHLSRVEIPDEATKALRARTFRLLSVH